MNRTTAFFLLGPKFFLLGQKDEVVLTADEFESAVNALQAELDETRMQGPRLLGRHDLLPTAADLGPSKQQVHEARQVRDAERVDLPQDGTNGVIPSLWAC